VRSSERCDGCYIRYAPSTNRTVGEETSVKVRSTDDDQPRRRHEQQVRIRLPRILVTSMKVVRQGERGKLAIAMGLRRVEHLHEQLGLHIVIVARTLVEVASRGAHVALNRAVTTRCGAE
jgi:hypothetical protein